MAHPRFGILASILLLALGMGAALAAPLWPGTDAGWTPLADPCGGPGPYIDPLDDFPGSASHHELDIVGGTANSVVYPSVFAATDGTNLMLRMRLDKLPDLTHEDVWQFLFDFPPLGTVDWSLQLDNKTDFDVEFVEALTGSPLFHGVHLSTTNAFTYAIGTFSRLTNPTSDNQELGDTGPGDTFLDLAIPWADFFSATGETPWNGSDPFPWTIYATTSDSHNEVNKDVPSCVGLTAEQMTPEPASLTLLLLGGATLLARKRRRERGNGPSGR